MRTPLSVLIDEAPELDEAAQGLLIDRIRADQLLLGYFRAIRNTAALKAMELSNQNLSTEDGVKAAIRMQGEVQGVRMFLQTMLDWDDQEAALRQSSLEQSLENDE